MAHTIATVFFVILFFFNFSFAKEEVTFEEIVVTATRTEKKVEEAPGSVRVVSKEELEIISPKTIDQAVNQIPGAFVRRRKGLMDSLPSIFLRGIPDQKRTLLLIDGTTLNLPYSGSVRIGGFSAEDLERIEVVKGPFSSLYGGYAMGGVVNFITKTPEKREFIVKAGHGSRLHSEEAMKNVRRFYVSYGDKFKDKLSVLLSYGRWGTDGYPTDLNVQTNAPPPGITGYEVTRTPEGRIAYLLGHTGDNKWKDEGITLSAKYYPNNEATFSFSFRETKYRYEYDDPETYLRDQNGNPVWSYPKVGENTFISGAGGMVRNLYSIGFETPIYKDVKIKLNASFVDVPDSWYVTPLSGATLAGCGADPTKCGYVTRTLEKAYMADLQFNIPVFGNQMLLVGASFGKRYADTKEKYLRDWRDEDSDTTLRSRTKGKDITYAVFLQDEIMLRQDLTFYVGFRQDWWKAFGGYVVQMQAPGVPEAGYPKEYPSKKSSSFSPRFSFIYKPLKDTAFRGSIGTAFRAPTIYELYRTWTLRGTTYAANPDLDPETVTSWELGFTHKLWDTTTISLTYFNNKMKDLIYRKSVNPQLKEWVNVGAAVSRGVEFEFEKRIENWIRFYGNFTYTHSEIKENEANPLTVGCRLTHTPLWMVNGGLEFKKSAFSALITARYVDKRYSNDDNSDRINNVYKSYDPYFLVDGKFSYKISKFAELKFVVENIFDRKYFDYYRAPGRSWFAELILKF